MYVFGNDKKARGCFVRFDIHTGLGSGAYLRLPDTTELRSTTDYADPMIVTALSFGQREKYHLVQCFQDAVHTYAFGHDPASSMISLTYTGFIIESDGTTHSNVFERFITGYKDNRLSAAPTGLNYSEILIGSTSLTGFLTGMISRTSDAHHNLQNFELSFLAVEVQG